MRGFVMPMLLCLLAGLFAVPAVAAQEPKKNLGLEQLLLQEKCTRCHDLSRALSKPRTSKEWGELVRRMAAKRGSEISDEDLGKLSSVHVERQRSLLAEEIFKTRCTKCHELDRALGARQSDASRWRQVINRMRGKNTEWVTEDEAKVLVLWHLKQEKP